MNITRASNNNLMIALHFHSVKSNASRTSCDTSHSNLLTVETAHLTATGEYKLVVVDMAGARADFA
jgi:hypothetical protein